MANWYWPFWRLRIVAPIKKIEEEENEEDDEKMEKEDNKVVREVGEEDHHQNQTWIPKGLHVMERTEWNSQKIPKSQIFFKISSICPDIETYRLNLPKGWGCALKMTREDNRMKRGGG